MNWMEFGEKIQVRRKRLKLSQQALADKLDISRNYLSQIEHGIADPSYGIVERICKQMQFPIPENRMRKQSSAQDYAELLVESMNADAQPGTYVAVTAYIAVYGGHRYLINIKELDS